jgi:hypothetical protein
MKGTKNEMDALDNIFGVKPKGAIFLPAQPYQVRFNCKEGCLSLGEDDHLGKEAEISILKVSRYFGTIGMTTDTEWLQIFFVGAAGCTVLPENTVCISYLKTRSLSNFQRQTTKLMAAGSNPAKGIFGVSFAAHTSGTNKYKSASFTYRERAGDAEMKQLEAIAAFMGTNPALMDMRFSAQLQCLDGLSAEEAQWIIDGAKGDRADVPALAAGK